MLNGQVYLYQGPSLLVCIAVLFISVLDLAACHYYSPIPSLLKSHFATCGAMFVVHLYLTLFPLSPRHTPFWLQPEVYLTFYTEESEGLHCQARPPLPFG